MKFSITQALLAGLALIECAFGAKGKAEIQACINEPNDLKGNKYMVQWSVGGSKDACMKSKGRGTDMVVSKKGITCISLRDVEVDSDGMCFWRESHWGMSYTAHAKGYSGATSSQWITGPHLTNVWLEDENPQTTRLCLSKSLCENDILEWDNDSSPTLYIVFTPGQTSAGFQLQDEDL